MSEAEWFKVTSAAASFAAAAFLVAAAGVWAVALAVGGIATQIRKGGK